MVAASVKSVTNQNRINSMQTRQQSLISQANSTQTTANTANTTANTANTTANNTSDRLDGVNCAWVATLGKMNSPGSWNWSLRTSGGSSNPTWDSLAYTNRAVNELGGYYNSLISKLRNENYMN